MFRRGRDFGKLSPRRAGSSQFFTRFNCYDTAAAHGRGRRGGGYEQISLFLGGRVRVLAVAGLCQNFPFPVAHFQTSF